MMWLIIILTLKLIKLFMDKKNSPCASNTGTAHIDTIRTEPI